MNAVPAVIVFTTLLVLAVFAGVLMLRTAFLVSQRAHAVESVLECVLSHPDSFDEVCDLSDLNVGGGVLGAQG